MALVRLTNREKAMFLNLAFRDELRFTASVIAGDARPSRERGRPRRGVALPLRPRRGVALPRGATIGCVPINLNPLNPLNLLNTLHPLNLLNLLNLLNHQDRYVAETWRKCGKNEVGLGVCPECR